MSNEIRTDVPKYELLGMDDNGNEIRLYRDGSKRNQNGQLIERPEYAQLTITSENAHEFHAMRKRKILNAIESKLKDVTKTNIPADAIAAIVGKRAEIAMKDDSRTGNEAAKIVLSAVDAYQDKTTEQTTVMRNEYVMDAATRELLEQILESRRENAIDATTIQDDSENNVE